MTPLFGALIGGAVAGGLILMVLSLRPAPEREAANAQIRLGTDTRFLLAWIAAAVAVAIVVGLLTRWISLAIGTGALVLVGRLWFRAGRERKLYYLRTEAISVWIDMLKDTLGSGAGLSQSIESTAFVAPDAIRPEVIQLASAQRTGHQSDALRAFGAALSHPTSDLAVLALIAASNSQARDLPNLLAKTAEQARSRNSAVLQIETERAQLYTEARATVLAIGALGVVISLIARDFLAPYSSVTGQIVLAFVMVMVVGSAALLVQSGRPTADRRLLAPEVPVNRAVDEVAVGGGQG